MAWSGPARSGRCLWPPWSRRFREIEQILQNSLEREVRSETIGELVMERLRRLDEVSYVRFASVYRQFKDVHSFMDELNKFLEEK